MYFNGFSYFTYNQRGIKIVNTDEFTYEYELSSDYELKISNNEELVSGQIIAELSDMKSSITDSSKIATKLSNNIEAKYPGKVKIVKEENGIQKIVVFTNKTIEDDFRLEVESYRRNG